MKIFILYGTTVLIWGFSWYAITFQIEIIHPLLSIAYRSMIASAMLFAFLALTRRLKNIDFTRRQHGFLMLQGIFLFSVSYWMFYVGTGYITSGLVAVIFSSMTLMNVFNQAILFKIPINKQVVLASIIGLTGITCVFWPEVEHLSLEDTIITGTLICLFASYLASLGNMSALRNARDNIPVLEGTAISLAYGAIFSFILAVILGAEIQFSMTAGYIGSLLYLGIFASALGFGCYLTVMKHIGADKAAYTTVLFPIVALGVSTIFENYSWTALSLVGVALILTGNAIVLSKPPARKNNTLTKQE